MITDIVGKANRNWCVTVYGKENSTIQKEAGLLQEESEVERKIF